jgi:hypothetical protein
MNMWDDDGVVETTGTDITLPDARSIALPSMPEENGLLQMLVLGAQNLQRDPKKLIERSKQIGGLLASDAFYRFPAGGKQIQGESIDLAEALAQEWGGVIYKVAILNVEEQRSGGRQVSLRASVADLKTLVCAEVDAFVATSAPPGKFGGSEEQKERWHSMQIQNASSKIVRNAILRVLPRWYVKPAMNAALKADAENALAGKSLPEARQGAIGALKEFQIDVKELETMLGQPVDMWAGPQLAELRELYKNLKAGAMSVQQWRAAINSDSQPAPEAAKPAAKSSLGLPVQSENKPLDLNLSSPTNGKEKVEAKKTEKTRVPGEEG